MATKTQTIVTSDLSGKEGAETVTFAVNGKGYQLDLTKEEAQTLYDAFAKYVEVSRPHNIKVAGKGASRGSKTPSRAAAIRAWAKEQGIEVNERGRVNPEVAAKYDAAH